MENRRKNLSSQLAHFEETPKNFSVLQQRHAKKKQQQQQQQKTNKQTKKHPTEATRPFAIHSLTWSLESNRLKNAAHPHASKENHWRSVERGTTAATVFKNNRESLFVCS